MFVKAIEKLDLLILINLIYLTMKNLILSSWNFKSKAYWNPIETWNPCLMFTLWPVCDNHFTTLTHAGISPAFNVSVSFVSCLIIKRISFYRSDCSWLMLSESHSLCQTVMPNFALKKSDTDETRNTREHTQRESVMTLDLLPYTTFCNCNHSIFHVGFIWQIKKSFWSSVVK